METLIIQVTNFKEFVGEFRNPSFEPVRVSFTRTTRTSNMMRYATLNLDVQGMAHPSELIWLHFSTTIHLDPGTNKAWTDKGEALMKGYKHLKEALSAKLESLGFTVKGGRFGIQDNIQPLEADTYPWVWDKKAHVFMEESDANEAQTRSD